MRNFHTQVAFHRERYQSPNQTGSGAIVVSENHPKDTLRNKNHLYGIVQVYHISNDVCKQDF